MHLGDEITKVIDSLCDKFGITVDWTSQNIIPYLQEIGQKIVNYEIGTSIVWMIIGIICLIIGIICFITYKKTNNENICFFLMISLFIIGGGTIITQIFDIITAYTLPEKTIYQQLYVIYLQIK